MEAYSVFFQQTNIGERSLHRNSRKKGCQSLILFLHIVILYGIVKEGGEKIYESTNDRGRTGFAEKGLHKDDIAEKGETKEPEVEENEAPVGVGQGLSTENNCSDECDSGRDSYIVDEPREPVSSVAHSHHSHRLTVPIFL